MNYYKDMEDYDLDQQQLMINKKMIEKKMEELDVDKETIEKIQQDQDMVNAIEELFILIDKETDSNKKAEVAMQVVANAFAVVRMYAEIARSLLKKTDQGSRPGDAIREMVVAGQDAVESAKSNISTLDAKEGGGGPK